MTKYSEARERILKMTFEERAAISDLKWHQLPRTPLQLEALQRRIKELQAQKQAFKSDLHIKAMSLAAHNLVTGEGTPEQRESKEFTHMSELLTQVYAIVGNTKGYDSEMFKRLTEIHSEKMTTLLTKITLGAEPMEAAKEELFSEDEILYGEV